MGMNKQEIDSCSIKEFNLRSKAFLRNDEEQWHKVRVLVSLLMQPHLKKGKSIRPQDLIPLPNDIKKPRISEDDMIADIHKKTDSFMSYWNRRN